MPSGRLKVFMVPDYRGTNTYQKLLADHLCDKRIDVAFPATYRRILPISRAVRGKSFNVLHLHWINEYFMGGGLIRPFIYAGSLLADLIRLRLRGIRIVWTVHNVENHDDTFPALERWLRRRVASVVNTLIVHGKKAREVVSSEYGIPAEEIHVIPHGHYRGVYGLTIPQEQARRALDLPEEGRLFLHLGMLRPYKGIVDLLEVWPAYHRLQPRDHLLIAGKSQNSQFASELDTRASVTKGVTLHDEFVPDDMIPVYFSAADVSVLPYRQITTSGSSILAMSFDTPVIAPRLGDLENVLRGADELLYDAPSRDLLLKALLRSRRLDLDRLAEQTHAACNRLSWDGIAHSTAAVYEELCFRSGCIMNGEEQRGRRKRHEQTARQVAGKGQVLMASRTLISKILGRGSDE